MSDLVKGDHQLVGRRVEVRDPFVDVLHHQRHRRRDGITVVLREFVEFGAQFDEILVLIHHPVLVFGIDLRWPVVGIAIIYPGAQQEIHRRL